MLIAAPARDPVPQVSGALILAGDSQTVAETSSGKVRGYVRNGIKTFKGIPYGAPVSGNARFAPPAKPQSWAGIRSSPHYGQLCPQSPCAGWASDENAFMFEWDDGQPGEDCLRVNIWTPSLDNRKRPSAAMWLLSA